MGGNQKSLIKNLMNKGHIESYGKVIILGFALVFLFSCHSQRTMPVEEKTTDLDTESSIISILEQRTHRFRTMKVRKFDLGFYVNGVSERIKGNMAMYRDSLIAVSVIPALGYEALRILCTQDSVIIINRPERVYYAASFEFYRSKYNIPLEFKDLQAILANEVFYYKSGYNDRIYEKQLNTRNENILFLVDAFREGRRITNQGIEINSQGRKLENVFVIDYDTKMRLNVDYEDFNENSDVLFPKRIRMDIVESNNTVKLDIYYGQIIFNDSLNIEFNAPSQYTRGDF